MQLKFGDTEDLGQRKRTRREVFLAEMDHAVPWPALLKLIEPHYPKLGRPGRQPYPLETMLRVHFLQQWCALSDPGMEEALYDTPVMRRFAGLGGLDTVPDETATLNFRRLLETHDLARQMQEQVNTYLSRKGFRLRGGMMVDATIIAAPSSPRNGDGRRDPKMRQTRKGNSWHFGMKAQIGVGDEGGLGYLITATPSVLKQTKRKGGQKLAWELGHVKASLRAKVEHPFRVIKRQFGYTKVRYRGLVKNTAQVLTLFVLPNLWMVRRPLLITAGKLHL